MTTECKLHFPTVVLVQGELWHYPKRKYSRTCNPVRVLDVTQLALVSSENPLDFALLPSHMMLRALVHGHDDRYPNYS